MEHIEVVIIGAGWFGLSAAKTYIQIHPDVNLVVLESADSIGGTWSKDRLYPGLRTNSYLGWYENPDFPMTVEKYGVKPGEHIPGSVVHQYMEDFAKGFDVWGRIRFGTKVEEVKQGENGRWVLSIVSGQEKKTITADKLIIATGVTGNANMPHIPGADSFEAPLFHHKEFLSYKESLGKAKKVAVYGGGKSAWDAVYFYATSGIEVEWVMRESGRGPVWMSPMLVTPLKQCLEGLVLTRLLGLFSPTFRGTGDGYGFWRGLLQDTSAGRWVCRKFFGVLEADVVDASGFDTDPDIKKLKPWFSAFWSGPTLSILNYPTNFFQYVKNGMVRVHHADITHLTPHTMHLSFGVSFEVDALHCATGYKHDPPLKFSPPSLVAKLGLPTDSCNSRTELTDKVDTEILARFPRLKEQPNVTPKKRTSEQTDSVGNRKTPYRLWNYMVPPTTAYDRTFAVLGAVHTLGTCINAQIQSLWITAYLDGTLELPKSIDEIEYSTEMSTRFPHWRYPIDYGKADGCMVFDTVPYFDELLKDLGLRFKRKSSCWRELIEAYVPADYRGIVKEWMDLQKKTN